MEKRIQKREDIIFNVTEDILVLLEERGMTKRQLAIKIGTSEAMVKRMLSGGCPININTLSDMVDALGETLKIEISGTRYDDL